MQVFSTVRFFLVRTVSRYKEKTSTGRSTFSNERENLQWRKQMQVFSTVCESHSVRQSVTNIFEYLNIFDPNIYSDIRLYHFLETNMYGYSFASNFWIQIYSDIRS